MSTYRDRPLPHSAPQLLEVRGEPTAFCSSSPSLHPPYHEHHAPLSIPNGHCPPPTQTMQLVAPPTQVPSRSSVPKMGIRARVADWPPRRDRSRESLLQNGHSGKAGGGVNQGAGPFRRSPALLPLPRRRREVGFGSRLGGSSPSLYRPPPPLQRSSSEVTLSEQDPAEQGAEPGEGPRLGAGLYREYGSTSSIDTAAIPEQSFSHLLSQFHRERSPAQDTPLRPTDQPRVRQKSGGGEGTTSSLLRKLRITTKGAEPDPEPDPEAEEGGGAWVCPRSFVHYDVQSLLFDPHAAAASQRSHSASQRKNTNTATGASAASTGHAPNHAEPQDTDTPPDGTDAAPVDNPDSYHDDRLLISCPHFHIEAPGRTERDVSFLGRRGGAVTTAATGLHHSNASVSVLEVPPELQLTRLERLQNHSIEHLDLGARYYRQHFHNTEHSNYFGSDEKLGPVALSIRREKLEDTAELKDQYQYRIILRTTELVTLRGTVLEDSVLSTSRHGLARGLPLKEVLEGVVPELGVACLRLALATPKVTEQLLKLDEQGLSQKRKVGVLLCRAGQSMEEEMYNNEEATPAFSHFLELLGERVCLRGFSKYAAQLDTKTDSTGTHSLYTTYQDYEVMFHVSTMLPYMPNNPQQLLRKRHIGNDIVTIIFQEPGALPFTPQSIRSHFQHVFIIVRVHNPCSDSTCYSVAVTSMEDVPPFGPPIPEGETFRDPEAFRDFLLAKVINGENAAHKSAKFHTMAMRTRREYLRDLAENCVSSTPLDSTGKLNNLISLASKRRERIRAREGAELGAMGTVAWRVLARDLGGGGGTGPELPCLLAISGEYMVLVDSATKEVVFNCFCADVIGWTAERLALKVYFGRGDHIAFSVPEGQATDVQDVLQRLKALTVGCNTAEMTLRRNGLGQLGFHVRGDGTVAEVEEYGFAWQAGLRPGSRLVEICKVAAVTLSHEHMIDLLRTSVTVKVLIIPPFPEGGARRGCTEEYDLKAGDHSPEAIAVGYHPPLRPQTWHRDGPPAPRHSPMVLPQPLPQSLPRSHKILVPAPYREPQHGLSKRPMSFPENHYSLATIGGDRVPSFRNPSGSFSSLGSGLAGPFVQYKPSPDRYSTPQRPPMGFEPHLSLDLTSSGESGFTSQESTMERCKTEPLWHIPASARMQAGGGGSGGGVQKRSRRQDVPGKDSPTCNSKGEAPYSSHSSSNTLSSNASSNHSDERWFEGAGPAMGAEPGSDALGKRGSSDSGIDAATLYSPGSHNALLSATLYNTPQELIRLGREPRRRGESRPSPAPGSAPSSSSSRQSKSYNTRTFPLPSTPSDAHKPSRSCYTPQGFQVSAVDRRQPVRAATVTPSSASRHSAQPPKTAPKPSYCRSAPRLPPPSASTTVPPTVACPGSTDSRSSSKQVEVSSKNVFGQPRLRASLRDLRSPRRAHKSTVEDDLKKLIIMDSTETPHRDTSPPRRTLQRTFSDESLSSSRRDSGPFDSSAPLTSDLLFTNTMPPRRATAHHDLATNRKVPVCVPEITPSEVRDRGPPLRNLDPGLMPLPDTDCGLEWSSLVNAARAYEVQRTVSLFSLSESRAGGPEINPAVTPVQTPRATPNLSSDEVAGDLPGRLHHLEVMLKQLNKDLEKEKQDKVALLAEVANLRENNQRLQEESQCASQQLRNLSQLLTSSTPDRK